MEKILILGIVLAMVGFAIQFIKERSNGTTDKKAEVLPIEKKPFVFDAMSELALYRQLLETFSDQYYVFPQMSYGRIIQIKNGADKWERNRFDKKIADFVLCDKERAIAKLIIELDGSSHNSTKKIDRDSQVDTMMAKIGLPILHLKTGNFDREYLKQEVSKKITNPNG